MTYVEALRWLARKYNIEIKERELTDKERQEQSERDSMFIVNEWAADYFKQILLEKWRRKLNRIAVFPLKRL